jgi:hypothetical protein
MYSESNISLRCCAYAQSSGYVNKKTLKKKLYIFFIFIYNILFFIAYVIFLLYVQNPWLLCISNVHIISI